jgi:hypothetical protein
VQAHREIKARLGVPKLSITDIFRFPVLADLAEAVSAKLGGAAKTAATPAPAPAPAANTTVQPAAPSPAPAPANSRADAMARRREMRARRRHGS